MADPRPDTAAKVRLVQLTPGLAGVIALFLLLWFARSIASILLLFFLAILLGVYLDALREGLARRFRLTPGVAITVAVVLTFAGVYVIWALLVPPVVEQTRQLITRLPDFAVAWQHRVARLVERFPALEPYVGADRQADLVNSALAEAEGFLSGLIPHVFDIVHGFINVVSVLVMGLYLALHPRTYEGMLVAVTPPRYRDRARAVLADLARTLRAWVISQLLAMTVLGVLTAFLFWLVDVPYWLTFGIFAGVAAIVPFFGTLVSTVAPALFVLGGAGGVSGALIVLLIGVVVHLVEANVVAPLIMQKGVHLPPVFSILAVLVVGKLLGPAGLLVAVPMLAVVMVLVRKVLIEGIYGDPPREHRADAAAPADGAARAEPATPA
ncbi:MAG: AI-2E family transporter [Gemmatimonadetes bacterium]|nr:AI-2E family transporter [Gemmatimonadota bacterium]MBI3568320.1 AI-2E family transporter [Gemmatimonadota bacterium]